MAERRRQLVAVVWFIWLGATLSGCLSAQRQFVSTVTFCNNSSDDVYAKLITGENEGSDILVASGECHNIGVFLRKNETGMVRVRHGKDRMRTVAVSCGAEFDQQATVNYPK